MEVVVQDEVYDLLPIPPPGQFGFHTRLRISLLLNFLAEPIRFVDMSCCLQNAYT